ncbi:hypothetical protein GCM10010329_05130 [Streptomyces spiroverticillatus]|uniref:Serine/arginine repetitive matrix protein 2 n=1 Tax=Streptomyces finlayi TaxID=67296 RepID=A0A918WSN7_9ACTN|nr:hypothetical protein [Streptomyces finlayi]GGZ88026.1 hypothetical protein GCM10010329_05130 [Streptomyces spiroverticillatus]GHC79125.1 hypothetical protein GCM10010334_05110 [Streptomyces finlayi]
MPKRRDTPDRVWDPTTQSWQPAPTASPLGPSPEGPERAGTGTAPDGAAPSALLTPGPYSPPLTHPSPAPGGLRPAPKLIAVTLLLAVALGGGSTWLALRLTDQPVAPRAAVTPAPPGIPGPAPLPPTSATAETPTSAAAEAPTLPPDFTLVTDPVGPRFAVPSSWTQSPDTEDVTFYRGSTDAEFLQFWRIKEVGISSRAALQQTVLNQGRSRVNFQEISFAPVYDSPHPETEELVYEYDKGDTALRVRHVERVFRASDGAQYAVLVSGPATSWPAQRATLTTALAHFTP